MVKGLDKFHRNFTFHIFGFYFVIYIFGYYLLSILGMLNIKVL